MATLAEIRARLLAQENKSTGVLDNQLFPHWNIPENTTCSLRFLPDSDPKNDYFWVEKAVIKLPFAGIVNGDSKDVLVHVPCMEMWNETCPVLSEVRNWFKDKSLEEMGRKYWKKRSYIFSGFVRENPLDEDSVQENPIRRFIMGPELFKIIKATLLDPELENLPTDYTNGLDFRITKTTKGGYADYGTSTWARRETQLTKIEREAIEKFGLHDLKDFLPKKPTSIELSIIQEMFEASVDGKPYDPDRWGAYYRPNGVNIPTAENKTDHSVVKSEEHHDEDIVEEKPSSLSKQQESVSDQSEDKAAAILAMIRSRQKA
jgi:hypothetical protein